MISDGHRIDVSLRAARAARTAVQGIIEELTKVDLRPTKSRADCFIPMLRANVDNDKLSDADFREFVRNSIKDM